MSSPVQTSAFDSETFGEDVSFHLDQHVGSMTISPSGRDVAIASREGLDIIDLDSPYSAPRHLPHRTLWDVADVQWSPFASRDYWVVSTSNQKALVWNLAAKSYQDNIEFVLHGHTRAITDINFSPFNPELLTTCAVDSFIHCWDLRTPLRPAFSFSDWFAAATQVKWSRQDEHAVASSHDKFLHIWDDRKGAIPVRTIEAHDTKIYGIDWNRFETNKIVTCSLDRRIKFWNTSNAEDVPERVINTPFPIWRARHTPFAWGLVAMPQRGSGDLFLYDRRSEHGQATSGHVAPVAKFQGHTGQVKEFLWRARGPLIDGVDHRDFQLISWGTDGELKLHRLDPEALENIGYVKGVTKTHRLRLTRMGARYKSYRDIPDDLNSPIEPLTRGESFPSQAALQFQKRRGTGVGMSKMPSSLIRGWATDSRKSSKIAMHARGQNKTDENPLSWLKNVRIATWDPDTLAEEIRHVAEKFKKVQFETVDVKNRKVVMALQAPWPEHQNGIYVRISIRFPQAYPSGANAVINVQKSGAVVDDLHKTLSRDLHTIAETYASHRKGCIEAVLRYLLREQSLNQIVTWLMGESVSDSRILGPDPALEEESSDSDDDRLEDMGTAVASSAANLRVPLAKGCGAVWSASGKLVCFFPPKNTESESILSSLSVQNLEGTDSNKLFEGFGRLNNSSASRGGTNGAATVDSNSDADSSDGFSDSSSSSSTFSEPATELPGATLPFNKHIGVLRQHSHSIGISNRSTTLAEAKMGGDTPRRTVVTIHDFEHLLPTRKELAQRYRLSGDRSEACKHNANVARDAGQAELSHVWKLASMILERTVPLEFAGTNHHTTLEDILVIAARKDGGIGVGRTAKAKYSGRTMTCSMFGEIRWGGHPLASSYLVRAMFTYYERLADVQMLAMLSSIFSEATLDQEPVVSTSSKRSGGLAPSPPRHNPSSVRSEKYYPTLTVAKAMMQPSEEVDGFVVVPLAHHSARQPRMGPSLEERVSSSSYERQQTTPGFDPAQPPHRKSEAGDWNRASGMAQDEPYVTATKSATMSLSASPEGNKNMPAIRGSGSFSGAQSSLSALNRSLPPSPPSHNSGSGFATSLKKYSPSGSSLAPGWGLFSGGGAGGGGGGGGGQAARGQGAGARASIHHYSESSSQDRESGAIRTSSSLANIWSSRPRDGRFTPEGNLPGVRPSITQFQSSASTRLNSPTRVSKNKSFKVSLHNQDRFDLDNYPAKTPLLDPYSAWKYRAYRTGYMSLLESWQLYAELAEIRKIDELAAGDLETRTYPTNDYRMRREAAAQARRTSSAVVRKNGLLQIQRCCRDCGQTLVAVEKNGVAIAWDCTDPTCLASRSRSSGNSGSSISVMRKKVSKRSSCSLCSMGISGRSTPCLRCGHLVCQTCAKGWYGQQRHRRRLHRHDRQDQRDRHQPPSSSASSSLSSSVSLQASAIVLPNSVLLTASTLATATIGKRRQHQQQNTASSNFTTQACCPTGCGCACPTLNSVQVRLSEGADLEEGEAVVEEEKEAAAAAAAAAAEGEGKGEEQITKLIDPHSSHYTFSHLSTVYSDASTVTTTTKATLVDSSASGHHHPLSHAGTTGTRSSSQPPASSSSLSSHHVTTTAAVEASNGGGHKYEETEEEDSAAATTIDAEDNLLNPWLGSKLSSLGKGIGGGLSRGLREKGQ